MYSRKSIRAEGVAHAHVFIGATDERINLKIDLTSLNANTVDADGYLKPGVPFQKDGTLAGGAPAQVAFGVSVDPTIKVADGNTAPLLALGGDGAGSFILGAVSEGTINRAILEDVRGVAITADEVAAFDAGRFTLTNPL